MDSSKIEEIDYEFPPFLRAYKDGRIERLNGTDFVPASIDLETGVSSKDVVILPELNLSARLFLPPNLTANTKLPLLVYYHGGGFVISSPFNSMYHNYLNSLVSKANIVAVSVDYRLAPEHVIPAAYEDSWNALKWVALHNKEDGPESWLNDFVDFDRVFLAGDSAGANIAYHMAMLAGGNEVDLDMKILGIALVHPYFWAAHLIESEEIDADKRASVDRLWPLVCPSRPDNDDPYINPVAAGAPSLLNLGCSRVLVSVAEKDILKYRGWVFHERLGSLGWKGVAEIIETEGEGHVFHLYDLACDKAKLLINRLAAFLNSVSPP